MTDDQVKDLLTWLLTTGTGAAVFALMQFAIKLAAPVHPLNARAKFYGSIVLSFLIPGVAYAASVYMAWQTFSLGGILGAFGTGFGFAQLIHFEDGQAVKRKVGALEARNVTFDGDGNPTGATRDV